MTFYGCPENGYSQGLAQAGTVEGVVRQCSSVSGPMGIQTPSEAFQRVSFDTPAFEEDVLLSGVPEITLSVDTGGRDLVHLTVVMDVLDQSGHVVQSRENYGYLNPVFRHGIDDPQALPEGAEVYEVVIDLYPQEDLIEAGQALRFTIAHDDGGRTIEVFEEGETMIHFGDGHVNKVDLPLRPAEMQGVRLA